MLYHHGEVDWLRTAAVFPQMIALGTPVNTGEGYTLETVNKDTIIQLKLTNTSGSVSYTSGKIIVKYFLAEK